MTTTRVSETQSPAADTPQPATPLTPEAIIAQLRVVRDQMAAVTPLTPSQRKTLHGQSKLSLPVIQASINVIGAHDTIAVAVGQPIDEVRQMQSEWDRWTAVEDELRTLLKGVSGANLVRRQRLMFIASQAYRFGSQLARDPENSLLVPQVQEIKRLRTIGRRKKAEKTSETPSPAPSTPQAATELSPEAKE